MTQNNDNSDTAARGASPTGKPDDSDNTERPGFPRNIRSFVRRQGRMTAGQQRAMDDLWPKFGIDYAANAPLNLAAAFGNTAAVTLEIGFGNGDNLLDMAAARPGENFLGIEVHEPGVGHCLLGVDRRDLGNVRVMRHDAVDVLRDMIPDRSLQRVNLFFPDPWHKKRHHKRRIVQRGFVELIAQKLLPGGILHIATDWPDYAEHIAEVLGNCEQFKELPEVPADRSVSRFDRRGQRLGHANWERAWCTRSKICAAD